jgi:hypothetical protein
MKKILLIPAIALVLAAQTPEDGRIATNFAGWALHHLHGFRNQLGGKLV